MYTCIEICIRLQACTDTHTHIQACITRTHRHTCAHIPAVGIRALACTRYILYHAHKQNTGYLTYDEVLHTYHQLDALRPTLLPTVFSETTDRLRVISPRVSRLDPQRFLIINRPATHMRGAPAPLPAAALFPIRQVMCVYICTHAAINHCPPRRCFPFVSYVCLYAFMCACMYVCMYVRTYVCVDIHSYIHTYMHTYIHTYIHTYTHTYTHTHTHTYIHTYIHTCMHTCIRAYMHTSIHTYAHTYTGVPTHRDARAVAAGGQCLGHSTRHPCCLLQVLLTVYNGYVRVYPCMHGVYHCRQVSGMQAYTFDIFALHACAPIHMP